MRRAFQLMPLQRQIVDVPVGNGVDEITGVMSATPGKFVLAQNARIVDLHTAEQRPGYAAMTTAILGGGNVSAARRLLRSGGETIVDDGNGLHTYVRDDTTWRAVDLVSEATIAKRIPGEHGAPTYSCRHDASWCSGMFVHAWTALLPGSAAHNCFVRITDELTGARLAAVQWACEVGSGVRVVVVPGSTLVYVFYVKGSIAAGRSLCCRWVDIDSPSVWAAEVVVTALTGTSSWDAQAMTATRNMIIYDEAVVGRVSEVDLNGAIQDTANLAALQHPVTTASISYDAAASRIYASYVSPSDGIRTASFTRGPLAQVFDVQVDPDVFIGGGSVQVISLGQVNVTGVGACLVYSLAGSIDRAAQTRRQTVANGGAITAGSPTYHVVSMSVPRWIGTRLYCIGYVAQNTAIGSGAGFMTQQPMQQPHAFLMEVPESGRARAVCRVGWGQSTYTVQTVGGPTAQGLNLYTSGYMASVGLLSENPLTSLTADSHEGFDLFAFDFSPDAAPLGCEQDGDLIMSGGVPTSYCGDRVSEYGFNFYPVIVLEKDNAGAIPVGTYGYAACFVHRDARGVTHRSAPIYASIVLAAGDDEVNVYVSQCTLTTRQDTLDANYPVQVELYRTIAAGTVYYHHSTANVDKSISTCTFDDINTVTDAILLTRRTLYTTGEVLENIAPPALRHVIVHNNRLWGISCDDADRIWLSKLQSLREAQGFNEVLSYRIPGADLVGLASLDGKLVAFGKRGIWCVFGAGPSDTNLGNDLADPQPVSMEHGCVDARSICVFPGGVTFQSTDGLLYVVQSSMAVQPISMAVYDSLHSYPTINSVTYIPDDHEIRVCATNTAGTASQVLVWNTLLDQWYTWVPKDAAGNSAPLAVGGALLSWSGEPDRYGLLLSTGVVLRESGYTDADATYPTVTLRTGPLAVGSIAAYQRVWSVGLLFEKLISASNSDVTLRVYDDHLTASSAWTATWSAAECSSAQTMPRLQLDARVPLANQKTESVALNISWTPVGGKNLRLQGMSLQLGMKAGRPRILPAAARK
jgi:hypothetical protein